MATTVRPTCVRPVPVRIRTSRMARRATMVSFVRRVKHAPPAFAAADRRLIAADRAISATPACATRHPTLARGSPQTKASPATTVSSVRPVKHAPPAFAAADQRLIAAVRAISATPACATRQRTLAKPSPQTKVNLVTTVSSVRRVKPVPLAFAAADLRLTAAVRAISATPACATRLRMFVMHRPRTKVYLVTTVSSVQRVKPVPLVFAAAGRRRIAAVRAISATPACATRQRTPVKRSRPTKANPVTTLTYARSRTCARTAHALDRLSAVVSA